MLLNLKAEMVRHKVTGRDIAALLQVREATVSCKINEISDFTVNEAVAIKEKFFPHYQIEYLFAKDIEKNIKKDGVVSV